MATFRKVHTKFWSDSFIQSLSPEKKFFYLYLLTNEATRQCGIYEITKQRISFDTGYNIDNVSILLNYFIELGKIKFNDQTNEIGIKNWALYNDSKSPKVQQCVNQELRLVKDKGLIEYIYSIDRVPILLQTNPDKNKNKNKNKIQEEEKEEVQELPPKVNTNLVCYNVEEYISGSQKLFEGICIAASKGVEEAKKELHKYHLWLEKNERYPMGNKAVTAGFESWLHNIKEFKKNYGVSETDSEKKMVY